MRACECGEHALLVMNSSQPMASKSLPNWCPGSRRQEISKARFDKHASSTSALLECLMRLRLIICLSFNLTQGFYDFVHPIGPCAGPSAVFNGSPRFPAVPRGSPRFPSVPLGYPVTSCAHDNNEQQQREQAENKPCNLAAASVCPSLATRKSGDISASYACLHDVPGYTAALRMASRQWLLLPLPAWANVTQP